MPEGHTIHRLARDHHRWFSGSRVSVQSPQGRFATEADRLSGRLLEAVEAFGKHLIYRFEGCDSMHVHLGLYGKYKLHRNPPPPPVGAVRVRLSSDERTFDLNGPNTCELMSSDAEQSLLARLGPDPLRSDADPEIAWRKIQNSRAPIGTLLLNQAVIAGLGNIYRAEILHILAIHPDRPGNQLTRQEFDQIWDLAVRLLRIGVKYNRIISVEPRHAAKPLGRLSSDERLLIYQQPSCPRCDADVFYWELGNRTIYACDRCQV